MLRQRTTGLKSRTRCAARRLCLAALAWAVVGQPARAADYAGRFDRMDRRMNNGRGDSDSLNGSGVLAWGEGYVLQSYVDMYRATGDQVYLDRLTEQFDRVLTNRDDARRVRDAYRNVPLAGWGSDEYVRGKSHVWAVHTGMICAGPMEFVEKVKAEQRLKRRYADKATSYLSRVTECVSALDYQWREGPNADEGHYVDPAIGPVPINQQNALGRVILSLYLVTRDHKYRDRVERLARYFKRRIRVRPDGAYDWSYWPKPDGAGSDSEDISHAAINIEFAVRCRNAHIVFNEADLRAFAKTWTAHVRRAQGEWADTVGGGGASNTYVPQAVGRWLVLCPTERSIFEDARHAFATLDEEHANGANLLGLARLARYQEELSRRKRPVIRLPRIRL